MGLETDAYKSIEEKLTEELESKNFNLHDVESVVLFEERIKPDILWMILSIGLSFFAGVLTSFLIFVLLSEIATEYILPTTYKFSFSKYFVYTNLLLSLISVFFGIKLFFVRTLNNFIAFVHLARTDYLLTDFFVMAQESVFKERGRIVPYSSIKSITFRQNLLQKIFNTGDIVLETERGRLFLHSVKDFRRVADLLLERIKNARGLSA